MGQSQNDNSQQDTITIGLFSTEKGPGQFNEVLFTQKDKIARIKDAFTEAAQAQGREPPKVIVSVLLIPDWKKEGNSYTHPDYVATQQTFINRTRKEFDDIGVTIQDFYHEAQLSDDDKQYMHGLMALGSNADMIKNRALFNNRNNRHLQLDSNTIIKNFSEFYRQTFAQNEKLQADAINASFYDTAYVSAHNKIIYTTPSGNMCDALKKNHDEYIHAHKDDVADKQAHKNSVYSKIFAPAMHDINLALPNVDMLRDKKFYPIDLTAPQFRITKNVVTAINMSWASKDREDVPNQPTTDDLKKLPSMSYGDAQYDFQSISYIIKKYTGYLPKNVVEYKNANVGYEALLNLSDNQVDMRALSLYFNYIKNDHPHLLQVFVNTLPANNKGNAISNTLFGCNAGELRNNPNAHENLDLNNSKIKKLTRELIAADKRIIKLMVKKSPLVMTEMLFEGLTNRRVDISNISKSREDMAIYQVLVAIENGLYLEFLKDHPNFYDKMDASMKTQIQQVAISTLNKASDDEDHFNYIPNREETLQILTGNYNAEELIKMAEAKEGRNLKKQKVSLNKSLNFAFDARAREALDQVRADEFDLGKSIDIMPDEKKQGTKKDDNAVVSPKRNERKQLFHSQRVYKERNHVRDSLPSHHDSRRTKIKKKNG